MQLTLPSFRLWALALMLLGVAGTAAAQDKEPRKSPLDSTMGKIGGANVKIKYSSPSVKGRTIYGDLVPYDKLWRAGANEATVFTTDKAVKVEGKDLPAGSYAFFVIPAKDGNWTVVFNNVYNQWGGYEYKEAEDAARAKVKTKKTAATERLVYTITPSGFSLKWADVEVPVSVK